MRLSIIPVLVALLAAPAFAASTAQALPEQSAPEITVACLSGICPKDAESISVTVGATLEFSVKIGQKVYDIEWYWGDGSPAERTCSATECSLSKRHTYTQAGTFSVKARIVHYEQAPVTLDVITVKVSAPGTAIAPAQNADLVETITRWVTVIGAVLALINAIFTG